MATWSRRDWLRGVCAGAFGAASYCVRAHDGMGPVAPPQPAPDAWVLDTEGRRRRLPELLRGNVTAVQTMFTGCSSTCPIQGALFGAVQQGLTRLRTRHPVRLLSLSVDRLSDSPSALRQWLDQFDAGPAWSAVVPVASVDPLRDYLSGRPAPGGIDNHFTQVYFFNPAAQLCWRSIALPTADDVLRVLAGLGA